MRRRLAPLTLSLLVACSPRGGSEGQAADSTAVAAPAPPPAATADSLAAKADSTGRADTLTKAKAAAPKAPVIGRDSAYGPRYMVDSTGKLVPIPQKRP